MKVLGDDRFAGKSSASMTSSQLPRAPLLYAARRPRYSLEGSMDWKSMEKVRGASLGGSVLIERVIVDGTMGRIGGRLGTGMGVAKGAYKACCDHVAFLIKSIDIDSFFLQKTRFTLLQRERLRSFEL